MSKNILIGALVVVIIILAVILLVPRNQDNNNLGVIYSPSPVISPVASPSPTPALPRVSQGVVIDKITVLSPNGGEVYAPGDILKITWKAPQTLQEVEISISQDCPKGATVSCSSANNFYQNFRVANSGSFSWLIPSTIPAGSYYFVSVADEFAMNSRYNDSSDSRFSILYTQ